MSGRRLSAYGPARRGVARSGAARARGSDHCSACYPYTLLRYIIATRGFNSNFTLHLAPIFVVVHIFSLINFYDKENSL